MRTLLLVALIALVTFATECNAQSEGLVPPHPNLSSPGTAPTTARFSSPQDASRSAAGAPPIGRFSSTQTLAAQGDAQAQVDLGVMYEYGEGEPQNSSEAVKWYSLAADQGNARAQYNLALMYAKGQGTPQSYVLAYMWFSLSAAQSGEDAIKKRDVIARSMTSTQIAEAQQLLRDWKPALRAHP